MPKHYYNRQRLSEVRPGASTVGPIDFGSARQAISGFIDAHASELNAKAVAKAQKAAQQDVVSGAFAPREDVQNAHTQAYNRAGQELWRSQTSLSLHNQYASMAIDPAYEANPDGLQGAMQKVLEGTMANTPEQFKPWLLVHGKGIIGEHTLRAQQALHGKTRLASRTSADRVSMLFEDRMKAAALSQNSEQMVQIFAEAQAFRQANGEVYQGGSGAYSEKDNLAWVTARGVEMRTAFAVGSMRKFTDPMDAAAFMETYAESDGLDLKELANLTALEKHEATLNAGDRATLFELRGKRLMLGGTYDEKLQIVNVMEADQRARLGGVAAARDAQHKANFRFGEAVITAFAMDPFNAKLQAQAYKASTSWAQHQQVTAILKASLKSEVPAIESSEQWLLFDALFQDPILAEGRARNWPGLSATDRSKLTTKVQELHHEIPDVVKEDMKRYKAQLQVDYPTQLTMAGGFANPGKINAILQNKALNEYRAQRMSLYLLEVDTANQGKAMPANSMTDQKIRDKIGESLQKKAQAGGTSDFEDIPERYKGEGGAKMLELDIKDRLAYRGDAAKTMRERVQRYHVWKSEGEDGQ